MMPAQFIIKCAVVVQSPARLQHQCCIAARCLQGGGGGVPSQCLWRKKYFSPDDDKKSFHGFTDEEIALSEKLNPFGKCLDQYICCYLYIL